MLDTASGDAFTNGANVNNMNRIRRQLSRRLDVNFGQRVEYNPKNADPRAPMVYYAFSSKALRQLRKGRKPDSGYIEVPRN